MNMPTLSGIRKAFKNVLKSNSGNMMLRKEIITQTYCRAAGIRNLNRHNDIKQMVRAEINDGGRVSAAIHRNTGKSLRRVAYGTYTVV